MRPQYPPDSIEVQWTSGSITSGHRDALHDWQDGGGGEGLILASLWSTLRGDRSVFARSPQELFEPSPELNNLG